MAKFIIGFVAGVVAYGIVRAFPHDDLESHLLPYRNPDPDEVQMVVSNEQGEWHFRGHMTDFYESSS